LAPPDIDWHLDCGRRGFSFKKVTLLPIREYGSSADDPYQDQCTPTVSIFYIHSIYKEPVIEEFQVEGNAIILKGVRTKKCCRHGILWISGYERIPSNERKAGSRLHYSKRHGEGQGLIVRDRKVYLSEIGEQGDRIRLRVVRRPLGNIFLEYWNNGMMAH